jgi:hypothetical protein
MLIAICLFSGFALPAIASDCGKEAHLKDPRLQVYFAVHRSIEAEFGVS